MQHKGVLLSSLLAVFAHAAKTVVVPQALQQYSINITIGDTLMNVLLDSGSGAQALKNCTSNGSCRPLPGIEVYDPRSRPGATILDNATSPACVSYGAGGYANTYCGWYTIDDVTVGDATQRMKFTGNWQNPGEIRFRGGANMGTGRGGGGPGVLTIPEALHKGGVIDNPTVSHYLDPAATYVSAGSNVFADAKSSFVTFGADVNPDDSSIPAMNDTDSQSHWFLKMTGIGSTTGIAVKCLTDTGGGAASFTDNIGPILYSAIGLSTAEVDACMAKTPNCIPLDFKNATIPITFEGSPRTFHLAATLSDECTSEGCSPRFAVDGNSTYSDPGASISGTAYLGVQFLSQFVVTYGFADHTITLDAIDNAAQYGSISESALSTPSAPIDTTSASTKPSSRSTVSSTVASVSSNSPSSSGAFSLQTAQYGIVYGTIKLAVIYIGFMVLSGV